MLFGNANTGIFDRQYNLIIHRHDRNGHTSAFIIISNGIVTEIVDYLISHSLLCTNLAGLTFQLQCHIMLFRTQLQRIHTVFRRLIQIYRFQNHILRRCIQL